MIYLLAIKADLLKGQSAGLLARWLDKNWTNCLPTDPFMSVYLFGNVPHHTYCTAKTQ